MKGWCFLVGAEGPQSSLKKDSEATEEREDKGGKEAQEEAAEEVK